MQSHFRCIGPNIMDYGNGQLINLLQDNWLADVPLSGWPTFISIDINDQVQVSDLFHQQGKGWNTQMVV